MLKSDAVISAFDAEHITRITGLSKHQLAYWDATDFFKPQYLPSDGKALTRVYSFRDAVSLRYFARSQNEAWNISAAAT